MNSIRLGIIGMGNIGRYHADYLTQGKVERCHLVAVCSRTPAGLENYRSLERFTDARTMIRSGLVDAVLVATPHPQHVDVGIAAFEAGLHVLMEKPIASHKAEAQRLVAVHQRHPKLVFGVIYQFRVEPRYQRIKELVERGELGELTRVNWITTDWFRSEAYYGSNAWRATWKGEGGGVLLNQALHPLDMLQWLVGAPRRLRAFCRLGRFHQIEVEDDVTAVMEWENGAMGTFVTSTGEAPGTNRLEICGTRGRLVLEQDSLTFSRNQEDSRVFSRTTKEPFSRLTCETTRIAFEDANTPHALIAQNFVDAVLDGSPLIAPGADGVAAVELANAMLLSSMREETIDLPLDGMVWEAKLKELIATSMFEKPAGAAITGSVADSFRR